jgi:phosphatidate cytidylyltransferase
MHALADRVAWRAWDRAAGGARVHASRVALLKRVASAAVMLPLFVLIVVKAPGIVFSALVVVASAIALWELTRLFAHAGRPVYGTLGVVAGTAVTASFGVAAFLGPLAGPPVLGLPELVLTLAVGAVLSAPLWDKAPATEPAANTLLAILYVGWLLGYGILLHASPAGAALVIFLVGVTWIGETTAYLVGSSMGRHKLAPVISPKKTVEGAVAQVVASIVSAAALGAWLLPHCGIAVLVAGGALIGVVGQVGDLAESVIKRSVGTKDASALIPGHGGLLDRIDSLLFNLPAFYYFTLVAGCR